MRVNGCGNLLLRNDSSCNDVLGACLRNIIHVGYGNSLMGRVVRNAPRRHVGRRKNCDLLRRNEVIPHYRTNGSRRLWNHRIYGNW